MLTPPVISIHHKDAGRTEAFHPVTSQTRMDEDKKEFTRKITNLTLEIISLLCGEGYTMVKKTTGDCVTPIVLLHVSGRKRGNESPITEAPHSTNPEKKILDLTNEITELLTGEVSVRCQDAAVYFSMEEWEYMEGQKDQYQEVRMKYDPPRIHQDKNNMTAQILILALQIIDVIKGKEQTVAKRTFGEPLIPQLSGGRSKIQNPNTEALHSSTPEKEILQLTKKITELLTGEVSLRCQDVALYFPMEQWDYVEGHWDQYKDLVMEERRPLVSPGEGTQHSMKSQRKRFYENASDRSGENVKLSLEYNVNNEDSLSQSTREDLDTLYREHFAKYNRSCTRTKPYSCPECRKCFITKSRLMSHVKIHAEMRYSCSECGKCYISKSNLMSHVKIHTENNRYSCSECGNFFNTEALLNCHQRAHTVENPFTCNECGMCFIYESTLLRHKKIHVQSVENGSLNNLFQVKNPRSYTVEKPYSCSECGKCFMSKDKLHDHQRSHTQGGSCFAV